MSTVYMTIGPAGAGKTTWAKNNVGILFDNVYSSDEYRERLLGNVNDQSKNSFIFTQMHKDIIDALNEGFNCCYDATNINYHNRSKFLRQLHMYAPNTKTVAVVFKVPIEIIKKQNNSRDRKVPEHAIERMVSGMELPFTDEFDDIIYVDRSNEE